MSTGDKQSKKQKTLNESVRFTQKVVKEGLRNVSSHHIESFNYAMGTCLPRIRNNILPVDIISPTGQDGAAAGASTTDVFPFQKYSIWFDGFELRKPVKSNEAGSGSNSQMYPSECRLRSLTYQAPLYAKICHKIDNQQHEETMISLGDIPVMVRSKHCNLDGLSEEQLIQKKEDMHEFGGYFIINGNERIIRMLIMNKRNYPVAFQRGSFINRGRFFTPYAVQMRCVRDDMFAQTVILHYLSDGNCMLKFIYQKQEFLIPAYVLLKALQPEGSTDVYIYNRLVKGNFKNRQVGDQVEILLSDGHKLGLHSTEKCQAFLGTRLRSVLEGITPDMTDIEVGRALLERVMFVHCSNFRDKFNTLCLMIEKLYSFVGGECLGDNLDSVSNQEVMLGGHLYGQLLAEKLYDLLIGVRARLIKDLKNPKFDQRAIHNPVYLKKLVDSQVSIGKKLENFLATGNLVTRSQLDLQQTAGFTIVADKLNFTRYLSHFRSIHRGQYFTEMKTTTVRKLLPEAWGYICPVHTPDGAPCGLLNHITLSCAPIPSEEINMQEHMGSFKQLIASMGVNLCQTDFNIVYPVHFLPVILDGILLGYIDPRLAHNFVQSLRKIKIQQNLSDELHRSVPKTLEIAYLPPGSLIKPQAEEEQDPDKKERNYAFPGIFMASTISRFVRPVQNLVIGGIEWIGPLEQVNLSIATLEEDIRSDTTHQELDPLNMLSVIASTIPFCNYNQSPRNMYQCQMAKQTMGTPYHNHPYRMDNKIYRLLFPQRPLVRTGKHLEYDFDTCPSGTNAVVAVISYTGYDMEDAMIINKSAYERGFGHGCVYKSYIKDLNADNPGSAARSKYKLLNQNRDYYGLQLEKKGLDADGLPYIGKELKADSKNEHSSTEQCIYDKVAQQPKFSKFKDTESARVESVRLMGDDKDPNHVSIGYTIRYARNPVIGDKFSSRHGQKGVLSVLWPQEDMPFTETGITPDVIINPHAFPSRMTIGMLIESLAGKGGAMDGRFIDVTPFDKYPDDDVVDYYGKELLKHGYNYYGNEVMYSGIQGEMMKVDIYLGLVYYQRLRHMVSDKSQARAKGAVDVLTQQPVKGRKKMGGIRFGEMERDSLLAHGASFCLNDRLMKCSDYSEGYVCTKCGSILSTYLNREILKKDVSLREQAEKNKATFAVSEKVYCRACDTYECKKVALPFVLRYMTNELAAMNIRLNFQLEDSLAPI